MDFLPKPSYPVYSYYLCGINKDTFERSCENFDTEPDMGASTPICLKTLERYPENCNKNCEYYRCKTMTKTYIDRDMGKTIYETMA